MRASNESREAAPGQEAVIGGMARATSISFALIDMSGRLVAHNPEFARAVGWEVATDDLSKAGTPLGDRLADLSKSAAWQGISVKTTWTEGGWHEYEILPAGDEGAIVLGHLSVPRSCLVADQDRQVLYRGLFEGSPLPMLFIEPSSRVVIDANTAACDLLSLRRDLLISMVLDQTGMEIGDELLGVPAGGRRSTMTLRPRAPGPRERHLEVMLNRVELRGPPQVQLTVLGTDED